MQREEVVVYLGLGANLGDAQQALKKPWQFSPELLPAPLNRFRNQYFPSLTADGQFLLFTVRNPTGMQEQEDLIFSEKMNKYSIKTQRLFRKFTLNLTLKVQKKTSTFKI